MTTTYVGSLSIGGAIVGAKAAVDAGGLGIGLAFPDIAARLAALSAEIAHLATMPPLPSFPEMLVRANDLVASITLAMAAPGLPQPPSIATAIAALEALITALEALVSDLNAKATLIAALQARLGSAGVHVVAFDGDLSVLGSELQAAITAHAGGSGHANALLLATTDAATWTDMTSVFQVTP